MSNYITLSVKQVIVETEDAATIVFNNDFPYKPGQFITLITNLEGKEYRRSYSLSSSPHTGELPAITVKKVANGVFSSYLIDRVRQGDSLKAMLPAGTFTIDARPENNRTIVLIGAGSGISPLMGVLKSVLKEENESKVYLIYGSRNENSIILYQQLEELKALHSQRLHVIHSFSQPLHSASLEGRLNQSHILKHLESFGDVNFQKAEFFICGPQGMMFEALKATEILNIPPMQIHKESFLGADDPAAKLQAVNVEVNNSEKAIQRKVKIIYSGAEYEFDVPANKTILQAALDVDIDLPYSCQSGMCTACMGKCTSGTVKLHDPDGLSENELKKGFVLTCVAQPMSDQVVIEID